MSKTKIISVIIFFILFIFTLFLSVNPIIYNFGQEDFKAIVNQKNLKTHVEFLTQFTSSRTHRNPYVLKNIADYIYDQFKANKCDTVSFQTYKVDTKEYKNVICRIKGKDSTRKKIVVGANYDVYAKYAEDDINKTALFKGADYNASGVSGVLELSRLVGKNKYKLENDIEFVAYTLGEEPFFGTKFMGSYVHAKSLKQKDEDIKFMISLEGIGSYTEEKKQNYPSFILDMIYPSTGDYIAVIGKFFDFGIRGLKTKMESNSTIPVYSLNTPVFVDGVDLSDHRNYWLFGYKAYLITDTGIYRNPNYHTTLDDIKDLDFVKMSEVVSGIYGAIFNN